MNALLYLGFLVSSLWFSGNTQEHYANLVRWAGCQAVVVVTDIAPPQASYFTVVSDGTPVIVLGYGMDHTIPFYTGTMILLHEVGHCLQYQEGGLNPETYRADPVKWELDADRRGADLACQYGLDGRRLMQELWDWAEETFGYQGDAKHGTLAQRRAMIDQAYTCDFKRHEAP